MRLGLVLPALGSVRVMSAFHKAQPRAFAQVSSGSPTVSRNFCRSAPLKNVQAMTKSQAGSPIPHDPKSMTPESFPLVVSRFPTATSP